MQCPEIIKKKKINKRIVRSLGAVLLVSGLSSMNTTIASCGTPGALLNDLLGCGIWLPCSLARAVVGLCGRLSQVSVIRAKC